MLLMLSGINSFKTIKEVIRGYTGDRKAKQIYSESDKNPKGSLMFDEYPRTSLEKKL